VRPTPGCARSAKLLLGLSILRTTIAQLLFVLAGNPAQWDRAAAPVPFCTPDPRPRSIIRPIRDAVRAALFPIQWSAAFRGFARGLGWCLALVGLYGSVSYAVSRRTAEMGIRSSLGATRGRAPVDGAVAKARSFWRGTRGLVLAISAVLPLVYLLPHGVDPWTPRIFRRRGAAAPDCHGPCGGCRSGAAGGQQ